MKKRNGFVSNSSSSSFIIKLSDLTLEQRFKIMHHKDLAPGAMGGDDWEVDEVDGVIRGYTYMDNFMLPEWIVDELGVDPRKVSTDEGHYWNNPFEDEDFEIESMDDKLNAIDDKIRSLAKTLGYDHPLLKEMWDVVGKVREEHGRE